MKNEGVKPSKKILFSAIFLASAIALTGCGNTGSMGDINSTSSNTGVKATPSPSATKHLYSNADYIEAKIVSAQK